MEIQKREFTNMRKLPNQKKCENANLPKYENTKITEIWKYKNANSRKYESTKITKI